VKGNKLVQNIREGIRLVGDCDRPFFGIVIKSLMILIEIFGTPMWVGKSGLKAVGSFL